MTGPKRVTEEQLAANRANSLRSTGPRTPEGRTAVRYNALKHGILAQAVIPEALEPYESREEFGALIATLRDEFAPANSIEELLVEQIATAYWRLARLYRAESGAIASGQDGAESKRLRDKAFAALDPLPYNRPPDPPLDRLRDLEGSLNNKRRLRSLMVAADPAWDERPDEDLREAAEREIEALRCEIEERARQNEEHDRAVDSATNSLPPIDDAIKFARYETALQNQLDRALSRLERLQRLRGGEFVSPPLQIQVSTNGGAADDV